MPIEYVAQTGEYEFGFGCSVNLVQGIIAVIAITAWTREFTEISEQGLAAAKKDKKPVMLIFFTEWCPHCQNYSKVFHDPAVVELSKKFVMIHLDKDKDTTASAKYGAK